MFACTCIFQDTRLEIVCLLLEYTNNKNLQAVSFILTLQLKEIFLLKWVYMHGW